MVIVIVTFPTTPMSDTDSAALLRKTAPNYQAIPGLERKYFVGNDEVAGGVYQWQDQAAADAYFNDAWREKMWIEYKVKPELTFLKAPCLVDNVIGNIQYRD